MPANKLDAERMKAINEYHDRIQRMQVENRKHEIDLITPERDLRLLRIKNAELEKSRGAQPNLKQNVSAHVKTLYDQVLQFYFFRLSQNSQKQNYYFSIYK